MSQSKRTTQVRRFEDKPVEMTPDFTFNPETGVVTILKSGLYTFGEVGSEPKHYEAGDKVHTRGTG